MKQERVGKLLIGLLTMIPVAGTRPAPWQCVFCGETAVSDAILNVLMFLPLGVGLAMIRMGAVKAVVTALALSLAVEVAQFGIPGRDASLGDLITNSLGCIVGIAVATTHRHWAFPDDRTAGKLAFVAGLLAAALFLATGLLLRPDIPDGIYIGEWAPHNAFRERFLGRVTDVRVASFTIPPERFDSSHTIRELLRADAPIELVAVAGPPVRDIVSLLSIHDQREREILMLGLDGAGIVRRHRTKAARLRLTYPVLRQVLDRPATDGEVFTLASWNLGGRHCFSWNGDVDCSHGFRLGSGWSLLLYSIGLPPWLRGLLDVLWAAVVLVPLGFWARLSPGTAGGIALVALAAALVPRVTGLLTIQPLTVISFLGGAGCGVLLRAAAVHLRSVLVQE